MSDRDQSTLQGDSHDPSKAESFGSDNELNNSTRETVGEVVNEKDVGSEKAPKSLKKSETEESEEAERDPKLVAFDGPDDPDDPRNWTKGKKWTTMTVVAMFTLLSPVSSTMVAPALGAISADLDITSEFLSELTLSIFILAYAVGPLFLGPLSEIYGRAIVLQSANIFYLAFNIGCGFAQNKGELIAFRFLSGLGGSVPVVVGSGVLGDAFRTEERGAAMALYGLAPLLGPAIGPIIGGFISQNTTWRWIFYATSIFTGVCQLAGFFMLSETYAPVILQRRAKKIRAETGDPTYQTKEEREDKTLAKALAISLTRPFKLLGTQPIVQVLALYMAYTYGIMYLMLATFPDLWTNPAYYGESVGIGGLNYISLGLGMLLGTYVCAILNDRLYKRFKARNNGVGRPEFRLPLLIITMICVPSGLFIYGWTAETHQHWIAPNIGACLFAIGNMMTFQCMQTYIVDTYTKYAASAMAAVSVLRCLAAFGFPLFAPYMYNTLHYGWGNSLLAFISIIIGIPAPIFLYKFGERLRKVSPYAAG